MTLDVQATVTDVLGEPYLAETIALPPDDEGEVVATLVKRATTGKELNPTRARVETAHRPRVTTITAEVMGTAAAAERVRARKPSESRTRRVRADGFTMMRSGGRKSRGTLNVFPAPGKAGDVPCSRGRVACQFEFQVPTP